jgi:hypothetical protein
MNAKLRQYLLAISLVLAALCGLALWGWTTPSYAGGPEATPQCVTCTGGMSETPVPDESTIEGYVYDFTTGIPKGIKDIGVTLDGCSWTAQWSTDDNGHFFFNNLGQGAAKVTLQLPSDGHAINPNVIVETSGEDDTYTVYLGFYRGNVVPAATFRTPDDQMLTGVVATPVPGATPSDGASIPGVGGDFPDPYHESWLSAALLLLLPAAGLMAVARRRAQVRVLNR